jgi:hypothetical protein
VSSGGLVSPPKGALDLTILHSATVADHEMVSDPAPRDSAGILPGAMVRVNRLDTSRFRGTVVQHDELPGM